MQTRTVSMPMKATRGRLSESMRYWRAASQREGTSWLQWALVLWLVVGIAVSVRTLARPASHTVFPIFAGSGLHWWHDQPLYASYPPLDQFRYSPVFAMAITPLSLLGLCVGGMLWSWLGLLILLAGLLHFLRDVLPANWSSRRQALFLLLTGVGALRGLWNAQSNALVVGLVLAAAARLLRERWWQAAFLLAAATWVKVTPLALALLLCVLWPRRLTPRLLAALIVLGLIPFATKPPQIVLDHYRDWLGHLLHSGNGRWPGFRDGWTLWLALRQLAEGAARPLPIREPIHSSVYRVIQLLGVAGTLGWCLWQKYCDVERRRLVLLTLAMGMTWLMLFGPAVEHATYVFLAPPLAWAVLQPGEGWRGRMLLGMAFLFILVLGWGAVTRPLLGLAPGLLAALPLGTTFFCLWLLGQTARRTPSAAQGPSEERSALRISRLSVMTKDFSHPAGHGQTT